MHWYLALTGAIALVYNVVGYGLFESRHDAAVIRNDKLAEKANISDARKNSAEWHVLDMLFMSLTTVVIVALTLINAGSILDASQFVVFAAWVGLLHGATRWIAHDIGVYYWWHGYWYRIVPTVDGRWDIGNRFDRWVTYEVGINHWIVKIALVIASYVGYVAWAMQQSIN